MRNMIAFIDVDYREEDAVAACVLANDWSDAEPAAEFVESIHNVAPYESGQFFRRELPCLLAVLAKLPAPPTTIVVDCYVWLGDGSISGLGAHLFEALHRLVPVVGVAKTRFVSATAAQEVFRGGSRRPLFVTAAGMEAAVAADQVRSMHGPFRIPTLLQRVDHLCRKRVATPGTI
jgi:deoxyribonuclease V